MSKPQVTCHSTDCRYSFPHRMESKGCEYYINYYGLVTRILSHALDPDDPNWSARSGIASDLREEAAASRRVAANLGIER